MQIALTGSLAPPFGCGCQTISNDIEKQLLFKERIQRKWEFCNKFSDSPTYGISKNLERRKV